MIGLATAQAVNKLLTSEDQVRIHAKICGKQNGTKTDFSPRRKLGSLLSMIMLQMHSCIIRLLYYRPVSGSTTNTLPSHLKNRQNVYFRDVTDINIFCQVAICQSWKPNRIFFLLSFFLILY